MSTTAPLFHGCDDRQCCGKQVMAARIEFCGWDKRCKDPSHSSLCLQEKVFGIPLPRREGSGDGHVAAGLNAKSLRARDRKEGS